MTSVDPVASQRFALATEAAPERVWSVLTCAETTTRYLHGMSLRSTWHEGAPVECCLPGRSSAFGQVLRARPPHHLSFTLEDDSGTASYVTWQVRALGDGSSVVRLHIDEVGDPPTGCDELEDVWLPVVEALREVLLSGLR